MEASRLFSLNLRSLLSHLEQSGDNNRNTASIKDLKNCVLSAIDRLDTQSPRESADGDPFGASGLRISQ
jgi:hypothetical protein